MNVQKLRSQLGSMPLTRSLAGRVTRSTLYEFRGLLFDLRDFLHGDFTMPRAGSVEKQISSLSR